MVLRCVYSLPFSVMFQANYELEKQREKATMNASNWQQKFTDGEETSKQQLMENAELQVNICEGQYT